MLKLIASNESRLINTEYYGKQLVDSIIATPLLIKCVDYYEVLTKVSQANNDDCCYLNCEIEMAVVGILNI